MIPQWKFYTDGHNVSDLMNDYLSSFGIKLQQQFGHVDNNLYEFAAPRLLSSFYISDISIQDIVTEISRLNTNNAVGSDNIGAKIKMICPEIFAYNLAKIFNRAIEKAEYPTQLKIARVIALYKKGNHYLANNYRPICLLSSFNKIYEKSICRQLVNFCEKNNILFQYQFGLKKNAFYYPSIDWNNW